MARCFFLAREEDLGTDLSSGPYKDSPLAQAFDGASRLHAVEVSDTAFMPPGKKETAFIAAPLDNEGTIVGVLAAQLDIDRVFALTRDYAGLGQTGQIVVGRKTGDEAVLLTTTPHEPQAASQGRYRLAGSSQEPLAKAMQGGQRRGYRQGFSRLVTCGLSGDTCPGSTGAWSSR